MPVPFVFSSSGLGELQTELLFDIFRAIGRNYKLPPLAPEARCALKYMN